MRWARGVRAALAVAVLGAGALVLGLPAPALAAGSETYPGPTYSSDYPTDPTNTEAQHKLWFHAGSWWALLLDPTGRTERVFQLMPNHTWRPTSTVVNGDTGSIGDMVQSGDTVHVVTRNKAGVLYYVRLVFDGAAGEYRAQPARVVNDRGAVAEPVIAVDSKGVLWVAYATSSAMVATNSYDGGLTWSRFWKIADTGTGKTQEAAALVAYDDRIGVLWSDQANGSFQFASHHDGDWLSVWTREQAVAGPDLADNHISLVRVPGQPSDTLVAAVKTSKGDKQEPATSPLIELLIRAPGGQWSMTPVSTIADGLDDPVIQVDLATRTLHLFAGRDDAIIEKRASLDDLRFAPGDGTIYMNGVNGNLKDAAVAGAPADASTGLVVLASDYKVKKYRFAEEALGPPPPAPGGPDVTAPQAPPSLAARAVSPDTAVVSWSPASDGTRWVPAADAVTVNKYVVLRDGKEIATVGSTSFQDRPRPTSDVSSPLSVEYQVIAVDDAGNRSPAARAVVQLPAAVNTHHLNLISLGLLALALLAGAYGLWRLWAARRMAARDRLVRDGAAVPDQPVELHPAEGEPAGNEVSADR